MITVTPLDPPLDTKKHQKIVPVPLLLNLYLPIELRASYLMRSALLATYCSSGGIPWPSLSNLLRKSRWRWIDTRYNNVINNSLIVLLCYSYAQSVQCRVYAVL